MLARHLFIVARDQPGLYDFLRQDFVDHTDVDVILDRRRGERRRRCEAPAVDRRSADRRTRPGLDDELGTRGYAIVHRTGDDRRLRLV